MRLQFKVPGDPVGKGRPRFVRATGRTYTPEKTERYENLVKLAFIKEYPDVTPIDGPISVEMVANFSVPKSWSKKKHALAIAGVLRPTKKPDTDNIAKIKDALNGIAWRDDAQVVEELISKYYAEVPSLTVIIETIEEEEEEE